ncbi:hypothetical protein JST56_05225 [Candidatus Dependentiae bacterium]|nr:hypothetical protein [Candidatus Dependentiae bacterium]
MLISIQKLKMSFIVSSFFFIVGCQAQDIIDFLLQNPIYFKENHLIDRLYDQTSAYPYARQFEKLFPNLYQRDKAEMQQEPCNRLIIRLLRMMEQAPRKARGLAWCGCSQAPLPMRIRLAMRVLDSVVRRFVYTGEKLVYSAQGSGKLLQDFIIIAGLIELGYSNLAINIIDIEYETKQQTPAMLYAQIALNQHIRSAVWLKQQTTPEYALRYNVTAYHDAYDYLEDVKHGKALRSNILTMVDPGDDLLRKEFKYRGPTKQVSLVEFVLKNDKTRCAIYLSRSKSFKYFYGINLAQGEKELIKSIIQHVRQQGSDKYFLEYLVAVMHEKLSIREVNFFQSPYRVFDDLAGDGALPNAIIFQLCTGVITSGVRDGLPIKHLQKIWF